MRLSYKEGVFRCPLYIKSLFIITGEQYSEYLTYSNSGVSARVETPLSFRADKMNKGERYS